MKLYNLLDLYSLKKNQWKSPQAIKKIQEKKLKKLITHAYQKVPFYRNLFNSNQIKPDDINTIEDLKKIPITTKQQLQQLPLTETMARGLSAEECKTMATSGTTGVPLRTFFTIQDSTLMSLSWARSFMNSGMKPWHKMLAFIGQQQVNTQKSWYEWFGLWRRMEVSIWDQPKAWISKIQESKTQILVGYEMTLKILAEAIQRSGIHDIRPKLIFHSSGILDNFSRNFLESVFHTKVIDFYGSDEAGCIAFECKKCSAYHICTDMVIVEVLKNGNSVVLGEEGEVIITNLHSYAMPFIRYRQEDVVTLSQKTTQCGRVSPLLENIVGRLDDFIITNSGEKISPTPFYHSIDPVPGVKRWKIVQENVNKITVEIEPGKGFDNLTIQTISKNLKRLLKDEFTIDISVVDLIPVNPATKFRAVTSKIKKNPGE